MAALIADRDTLERSGAKFSFPAKAGAKIFAGALAILEGGYLTPARTALNLTTVGIAEVQVDNTGGADGAVNVPVVGGVFQFGNDGGVTRSHIGGSAYIVDDQTVAEADGGGTRSVAGKIVDVDADGVWVKI